MGTINVMEVRALKPSTLAAAEQIKAIELFKHCGELVADENIIQVHSWDEAVAAAQSNDWRYASVESMNLCREALVNRARDRFQQWNNIVFTIKHILRDVFQEVKDTRPNEVQMNVVWVLMNYLVEKEYEDLYPNGYNQEWIKWYFAGHHICGWKGEFPDGKLIVY